MLYDNLDNEYVNATTPYRSFRGTVIERSYDGEPIVLVRDNSGHEVVIRPNRERYDIEPADAIQTEVSLGR